MDGIKPSLPMLSQTGIGDRLTAAVNKEVKHIPSIDRSERKRRQYATYSDEDRTKIGRYTESD